MIPPVLSIVIANYNYGRFLDAAIMSVVEQVGFDKCELIVVDGGSTDTSVAIIKKYARGLPPNTNYYDWINSSDHNPTIAPLITWWCSEKDGGQSEAFNKGFAHSRGRFGCWLNADDLLATGALKAVINYIESHHGAEWIGGSSVFVDGGLNVKWCSRCVRTPWIGVKNVPYYAVNGPSSFFLIDNLKKAGGFDQSLRYTMDTDLWRRFVAEGIRLNFVKDYIWIFRIHEKSKTSHRFMIGKSISAFAAENAECNRRYGISSFCGRLGCRINQLLRFVSGTYLVSWWDTVRSKGRPYSVLFSEECKCKS